MAEPVEVVTLGECMVGMVAREAGPLAEARSFDAYVAGTEGNMAIGLARLGHRAAFIGRVGDDGFGLAIRRDLAGEGVDISGVVTDSAAPTGLLVRETRGLGSAEVVYYRRGSAGSRLCADDISASQILFEGARWLHLTGITPGLGPSCLDAVVASVELARRHGLEISLDANLRRKVWTEGEWRDCLLELLPRCTVVLAGAEEAEILTGQVRDDVEELLGGLSRLGPDTAVLRLGELGAAAKARGSTLVSGPPFPVGNVIDTVGAGDAFTAGWIAARLEGRDAETALAWGNAAGAFAVATRGDHGGLPTRIELERLLRSKSAETIR